MINIVVSYNIKSFRNSMHNSILKSKSTIVLNAKNKYKVTIQHGGKDTILDVAEDCSVLNAALDAGIELPYDCNLGVCLTCPSKIVSGKVDQTGSTLEETVQERGYALTCMTYPRSDCVIKSIEEDELVSAQFER
jgi:ferredoxin